MNDKQWNERIAKLLAKEDSNVAKVLSKYESELKKNYQKSLDEIRLQIAKYFEKYGDGVTLVDSTIYNRLTNLELQIAEQLKELHKESSKTISNSIKYVYTDSYYRTGFVLETNVASKMAFGLLSPAVIQASILNQLDRIKWTDRSKEQIQVLNKKIKEEISQGLIQGKGYVKVAKAIKDKFEISTANATRIVRTESHRAQNAGKLSAFDKATKASESIGIGIRKVWIATLDLKTRDSHRSMDGQLADENGIFTLPSGATTEGPGLSGIAEEDINCRCGLRTEIEGVSQKYRLDNISKELISYQTYEEWYNNRIS